MGSLDVDPLFTNVPLEETFNICSNLHTMANVFLSFYEIKWLEQCPKEFKPAFYRRYVDDLFVLFQSAEHLSKFCD